MVVAIEILESQWHHKTYQLTGKITFGSEEKANAICVILRQPEQGIGVRHICVKVTDCANRVVVQGKPPVNCIRSLFSKRQSANSGDKG